MTRKVEAAEITDIQEVPIKKTISKNESVVEPLIYIGESLSGGKLQQFSIFNNGIPDFLKEDIERCQAIKMLMVPIANLNEKRQKLVVQGSAEHTFNTQIQQYIRGDQ